MKTISSRANPYFKDFAKLAESSRQRRKSGYTLLDGVHLVEAYLHGVGKPASLVVSESGLELAEIKNLLARIQGVEVVVLTNDLFHEVSQLKTPTGIIAVAPIPVPSAIPVPQKNAFTVLLEEIQDPGNVGAILRSAAAAGASDVHLSRGCADAWSPRVLRAAMGAHFALRIHEHADLPNVARGFAGQVIATRLGAARKLYELKLAGPVAFVFGNEGAGLSEEILLCAHESAVIPMPGRVESLNAASAAAICFFERVRQLQSQGQGS